MSLKWIIIAILAFPVAEVGVYLLVASQLGFLRTFLLQVVCSLAGFIVLRRAGRAKLARWKAGVRTRTIPGLDAGDGGGAVLGGILLLVPGFITDAMGICVLVPPLRRSLGVLIRQILTRYNRSGSPDAVTDLAPEEWREIESKRVKKRAPRRRT